MNKKILIISAKIKIGLLDRIFLQLIRQPKIVEGNQIALYKSFTHHSSDVWEVKFSPNDTLMVREEIKENANIWSKITGEVLLNLSYEIGTPEVD